MTITRQLLKDIEETAKQFEALREFKADGKRIAIDFTSNSWSSCLSWMTEPGQADLADLLRKGLIREALGAAFSAGCEMGRLRAHMNPAHHKDPRDVAPPDASKTATLNDADKREQFHRLAQNEFSREFVKAKINGPPDDWLSRVPDLAAMKKRLDKQGVPKDVVKANIPPGWPKGKRGPRSKG
jgi:hypothetical protein